jgi:hypothetical protein
MDLLAAAIREAPRRWRMAPLPADVQAAAAAPVDVALAFALECVRTGAVAGVRELFVGSLAALVAQAADPQGGDPAFQALVTRANDATVREFVALQSQLAQDMRSVRRAVDAIAHPAKLVGVDEPERVRLAALHALAKDGRWGELRGRGAGLFDGLAVRDALHRLVRGEELRGSAAIAGYMGLLGAQGPLAGSAAAAANGRDSARAGDAAEAQAVDALQQIADGLMQREAPALRVVNGLRTPRGFPGDAVKAKDEWDVALLDASRDAARVLLLGEVKASPAAAPSDFSRLHRGLLRFGQAEPEAGYTFPCTGGAVTISGESLRELAPADRDLPPHVVYFSTAPASQVPPPLSAASKAVLLAEPASVTFARDRDPVVLERVWDALATEPRLRATLNQFDTATRVCAAMLHPEDLLATFRALLDAGT